MADTMDSRTAPGMDAAVGSYATTTRSVQTFATEMQRMAKQSMEQTSEAMDKLRGARTLEEVVSIQTSFLQRSFSTYADYTRRFSELMLTLPMELARQGQAAFHQGADSMTQAAERVGDEVKRAGDTMTHG